MLYIYIILLRKERYSLHSSLILSALDDIEFGEHPGRNLNTPFFSLILYINYMKNEHGIDLTLLDTL